MSTRSVTPRLLLASVIVITLAQLLPADLATQQEESLSEAQTVEVHGTSIEYIDYGGEGPTVLLITPWDASGFGRLGPLLAGKSRAIAVTLPFDLRIADNAGSHVPAHAVLASFMDAVAVERAVLVSQIGDQLVYMGEQYPQSVAGLVFLGAAP